VIVADTNVLSEPLRIRPDRRVLAWLGEHADDIALTTITIGELFYGALRLEDGRRRDGLLAAIETLVTSAGPRVLPYDEDAARHYARLRRAREAAGRTVGVEDTMIAAICLAGGHAIATRNTSDFDLAGLEVVNPWDF
jgi:predicted nucleic acid-binding protein